MTEVIFHPLAQAELDASAVFYESRLNGLGKRLAVSVEEAADGIAESPAAGAPLAGDFRRRIVAGFPFSVIYRVWEDYVFVVAHHHRRPGYWRERQAQR